MSRRVSRVHKYKIEDITNEILDKISQKVEELVGYKPFSWQLDAILPILCGEDVWIDVGTGCGKSLCFLLSTMVHSEDIALVVSPLSALMLDQVRLLRKRTFDSEDNQVSLPDEVFASASSGCMQGYNQREGHEEAL